MSGLVQSIRGAKRPATGGENEVPEQKARITSDDVDAVGQRLQELQKGLPEGQQAVVNWLLQRASEAPAGGDEVQGYGGIIIDPMSNRADRGFQLSQGLTQNFHSALGLSQFGGFNPGQKQAWSVSIGVMF
jgi:hypothetical protein